MRHVRRLLLLRHGQAANPPGWDDTQRPLTERGELDAADVGRWLHRSGITPDLVVCSTARRTRRTWEMVAAALATAPPVSYEKRIYDRADDASGVLVPVRDVDDDVGCLLVVGHNPAVGDLAANLTGAAELHEGFPAGSLAVVDVTSGWGDLAPDVTTLVTFVPPARGSR